jgi:hypothetical protein
MHLDQPHKGMKAAKNVASLSPRWRGIKEVELSAEEIWEVYNGCSPQVKKQKCRKSLIFIGFYAEQQAFF